MHRKQSRCRTHSAKTHTRQAVLSPPRTCVVHAQISNEEDIHLAHACWSSLRVVRNVVVVSWQVGVLHEPGEFKHKCTRFKHAMTWTSCAVITQRRAVPPECQFRSRCLRSRFQQWMANQTPRSPLLGFLIPSQAPSLQCRSIGLPCMRRTYIKSQTVCLRSGGIREAYQKLPWLPREAL